MYSVKNVFGWEDLSRVTQDQIDQLTKVFHCSEAHIVELAMNYLREAVAHGKDPTNLYYTYTHH